MPSQPVWKIWYIVRGLSYLSSIRIIRYRIVTLWRRAQERRLDQRRSRDRNRSSDNGQNPEPILKEVPHEPRHNQTIPKIIFQTWKSRVAVPSHYRYWRSTFIRLNPEFQYVMWDDDDNRAFIANEFPWFLPMYDDFPAPIFRADAVRPFFLFRYGGLYADMDTECLLPLSKMTTSGDIVLGQMGRKAKSANAIPNAIMASKAFQLFWLLVIALMIEKAERVGAQDLMKAGPEPFTGPVLLHEAFDLYRSESERSIRARAQPVITKLSEQLNARLQVGRIELLAPHLWYPLDWTNPIHKWLLRDFLLRHRTILGPADTCLLFPKSALVTYWTHTW